MGVLDPSIISAEVEVDATSLFVLRPPIHFDL